MAGARIKDITGEQTLFQDDLVLLVDRVDTGSGDWLQARKLELSLLGNTYYQGSSNGITWHDEILSSDTYIRFTTDGGTTWINLDTDIVREGSNNLYFTEARVLGTTGVQDAVDNSHTHDNKTLLDNLISSGDGNSFLSNDGSYTNLFTTIDLNDVTTNDPVTTNTITVGGLTSTGLLTGSTDATDDADYPRFGQIKDLPVSTFTNDSEYISSNKLGIFASLDSSTTTTITTAATYYPIEGTFTNSPIEQFEVIYSTGSITIFADAGSGQITVTSVGHGLSENDLIVISDTTNYDGVYTITNVTTDTFEITATFVATETGTWTQGPAIRYTGTDTYYFEIDWHSSFSVSDANSTITTGTKQNGVLCDRGIMLQYCKNAGEVYHSSGTCVIELANNDEIQLVVTADSSGDIVTFEAFVTTITKFFID